MGMCFAFSSRRMHKKIVNDKESTRLILAVKLSCSTWKLIWQMSNDPEADTDRKIINYILKPKFIPPMQDKMAYISKFMNPKITDQRKVMYSFWRLMKGTVRILWPNETLDIKIFTDTLCTSNSELYNVNQLSMTLNIHYVLYFSKSVCLSKAFANITLRNQGRWELYSIDS